MAFKSRLIKSLIVEAAKLWRQTTERSDQSKLSGDLVNDQTEPNLLGKLEAILGFTLHLRKRISCREKIGDQVIATVCREGKIANAVGRIESPTHQIAAGLHMSRPGDDDIPERHIGPCLKTLQSAFFHELISKLTESRSGLVVAEARSSDDRKPYIGEAGRVADAMLEAEIYHPANDE